MGGARSAIPVCRPLRCDGARAQRVSDRLLLFDGQRRLSPSRRWQRQQAPERRRRPQARTLAYGGSHARLTRRPGGGAPGARQGQGPSASALRSSTATSGGSGWLEQRGGAAPLDPHARKSRIAGPWRGLRTRMAVERAGRAQGAPARCLPPGARACGAGPLRRGQASTRGPAARAERLVAGAARHRNGVLRACAQPPGPRRAEPVEG